MNVQMAVKYSIERNVFASGAEVQEQCRQQQAKDAAYSYFEEGWKHSGQGRAAEAERCYRRSFEIEPAVYTRLCGAQWVEAGDYARGWALVSMHGDTHWSGPDAPARWNGQRVKGTLAVMPSGGLGDQILFARFLPQLKERAGRVVLAAPKPLLRLFRRIEGADDVLKTDRIPNGQVSFAFPGKPPDSFVEMDALPHHLGIRMDAIPTAPYIKADPADVERWRSKVPHDGLRVGLVWKTCKTAREPHRQSLPSLATLAPLWQVPGISFVSLQRGDGEDEARASTLPIAHDGLVADSRDLADTVALISQLDLVIGTDVCVLNLAGDGETCVDDNRPMHRLSMGWLLVSGRPGVPPDGGG